MFGYIILRDIPKKLVQLDLLDFPIRGGFRGFAEVNPGPHYVSIKVNEEMHKGFWCWVKPGEVIVKMYDYEKDILYEINLNDSLTQVFNTSELIHGRYKIIIDWEHAGIEYFQELAIFIN